MTRRSLLPIVAVLGGLHLALSAQVPDDPMPNEDSPMAAADTSLPGGGASAVPDWEFSGDEYYRLVYEDLHTAVLGPSEVSLEAIADKARGMEMDPVGLEVQFLRHLELVAAEEGVEVQLTDDAELAERVKIYFLTGVDIAHDGPVVYLDLQSYFTSDPNPVMDEEAFYAQMAESHPAIPLALYPMAMQPKLSSGGAGGSGGSKAPCSCNFTADESLPSDGPNQAPEPDCCIPQFTVTPCGGHLSTACVHIDCEWVRQHKDDEAARIGAMLAAAKSAAAARAQKLATDGAMDGLSKIFDGFGFVQSLSNAMSGFKRGQGGSLSGLATSVGNGKALLDQGGARAHGFNADGIRSGQMTMRDVWDTMTNPIGGMCKTWADFFKSRKMSDAERAREMAGFREDVARLDQARKLAQEFEQRTGNKPKPAALTDSYCGNSCAWVYGNSSNCDGCLKSMK